MRRSIILTLRWRIEAADVRMVAFDTRLTRYIAVAFYFSLAAGIAGFVFADLAFALEDFVDVCGRGLCS
jgi:hypothetical protein